MSCDRGCGAADYFGKVKQALEGIDQHQAYTRPVIEALAREYQICPFEFSLDLALWADCIICDYNYAFDPRVYLHRFFDFCTEPYIFLVDEAHNLPDRAREMYSAEIDKKNVLELQRALKPHLPDLAQKLNALNKVMLQIRKACQARGRNLVENSLQKNLLKAIRNSVGRRRLAGAESDEFRQDTDILFPVSELPAHCRVF